MYYTMHTFTYPPISITHWYPLSHLFDLIISLIQLIFMFPDPCFVRVSDPLMSTIMQDPVLLPTSNNILDRST